MPGAVIHTLGLTLLHFLWEGTLIGLAAAAALRLSARLGAHDRYVVCLCALIGCALAPVVTALIILHGPTRSEALAATSAGEQQASWQAGERQAADCSSHSTRLCSRSTGPLGEPQAPSRLGAAQRSTQLDAHQAAPQPGALWLGAVALWFLGALSFATYYFVQWLGVERVRRSAYPLRAPLELAESAARLLRRWRQTTVPVMLSDAILTPIVIGLWRPMVIFPAAMAARMSVADFELILLHELAHIVRRDAWVNAMQVVLEILLFYHPVVHWLSRRARLERECACDDFAVRASGSAYQYARALASLSVGGRSSVALSLGAAGGDLLPRLRNLAGERVDDERFPRSPAQFLALLLLLLCLIWIRPQLNAQWPPLEAIQPHRNTAAPDSRSASSATDHPTAQAAARPELSSNGTHTVAEDEAPSAAAATHDAVPTQTTTSSAEANSSGATTPSESATKMTRRARQSEPTTTPANVRIPAAAVKDPTILTSALSEPVIVPSAMAGPMTRPAATAEEIIPGATTSDPAVPASAGAVSDPTIASAGSPSSTLSRAASDDEPSPASGQPLSNTASGLTLIFSPAPTYPLRARLDGTEGTVVVGLRVGADGRPVGLQIVDAQPLGVFEGAVRHALMRWRFEFSNGGTPPSRDVIAFYRLSFSLSGITTAATSVCATATASRTCRAQ